MKKNCTESPICSKCGNTQSIICGLNDTDKNEISYRKDDGIYKKGDIIFKEGNNAHNLFCVHKGKIKLSKLGKDGKEQIVRFAKSGDILGYRSLLSNEPYHATATAMEESEICVIPKEVFQKIVEDNYKLSLNLIQLLSKDLKSAEQHLIDVAQKTVRERISEALLLLITSFGYLADGKTINVHMTRSEIADLAGTTTETTIRTLSQLSHDGIISLEGKNIVITNHTELIRNTNTYD
ncbi:MAG: Crp/Fnr family transcriptional regulator [Flavobacteriia bacterium]|nr:Crp/Fnr family transcriptional regulator [Flavobacteriia bacterium]